MEEIERNVAGGTTRIAGSFDTLVTLILPPSYGCHTAIPAHHPTSFPQRLHIERDGLHHVVSD